MTADKPTPATQAVIELIQVAYALADEHGLCPLCLIYDAANATAYSEEQGLSQHGIKGHEITHPPHKTVL